MGRGLFTKTDVCRFLGARKDQIDPILEKLKLVRPWLQVKYTRNEVAAIMAEYYTLKGQGRPGSRTQKPGMS